MGHSGGATVALGLEHGGRFRVQFLFFVNICQIFCWAVRLTYEVGLAWCVCHIIQPARPMCFPQHVGRVFLCFFIFFLNTLIHAQSKI